MKKLLALIALLFIMGIPKTIWDKWLPNERNMFVNEVAQSYMSLTGGGEVYVEIATSDNLVILRFKREGEN